MRRRRAWPACIPVSCRRVTRDSAVPRLIRKIVEGMEEHDVLTYASAIAFQVLTSLIPLALLVLSLMGLLHLESVWTEHLGPEFKAQVSKQVYAVADDVVRRTLGQEQLWWLTAGVVFTVWQVSGAARAIMGVLSEIYNEGEDRSFKSRYATSIALGTSVPVLVLFAFVAARFGGKLVGGVVGFVLGWAVALGLLFTAVWLLLRFAPAHPSPHRFVSFGSALCVLAWVATSLVFGLYITEIADYGSIFGSLATVFVLLTYLYLSAVSFLIGAEVDAIVRDAWQT
jgi:membrane protein